MNRNLRRLPVFVFFVGVVIFIGGPDNVGDNLVPTTEIKLVGFLPTAVRRVDQLTPVPRPANVDVSHRRWHFPFSRPALYCLANSGRAVEVRIGGY